MSAPLLLIAIGIGILMNMISFEVFGLALGGMVVPGYMALNLSHPSYIVTTFLVAIFVFLVVRLFSYCVLIFGRRHLMVAIFLGFLLGSLVEYYSPSLAASYPIEVVGYIVPGLIAYWMERQGIVRTIVITLIGSIMTHLLVIFVTSGKVLI
jgi:poly-gamma-glutamate biosynthesis protein PgsC/CapC